MPTRKNDDTSQTLLARIRSGEEMAWARLVQLYTPLVGYWCHRRGVAEADLDDLVQEIWLGVLPTLGGFQSAPGQSFRGWLRGVTHHKTQNWHRRRSQQLAEGERGSVAIHRLEQVEADLKEDLYEHPEEQAKNKELYRRLLMQVKSEFEERTWKAFEGVAIDARSVAEVSLELGLSPAAVRMAKSRVLRKLRQELGELMA